MQVYRKEFNLLKKTESVIGTGYRYLGLNKKQEITRLLYEISKKERLPPEAILREIDTEDFKKLKQYLLKRRFPYAYSRNENKKPYLPKLTLDPSLIPDLRKNRFYPKIVFIERRVSRAQLAYRFRKAFPRARFQEIDSLKGYLKKNMPFSVKDYNKRRDLVFITDEKCDFFKSCPCTRKAVRCNYNIFNLSFGCIFECTYCYLQEYSNTPGLIFSVNIERFFRGFNSYKTPRMRIGTGEFSDSLMLDDITEYSLPIIDFFKKHKDVRFEFKTKSKNIGNLLKVRHYGNILVSWTLNPQKIIDKNELFTSSLNERLSSARLCMEAGYKLAFHFDPVIYFKGFEKEYEKVIGLLFRAIKPKDIAWISIGTLRFNPGLKQIIERRFPDNKILDEELVLGFDNKLRYTPSIRHKIYRSILENLSKHSKKIPIYLCMEDAYMWSKFKSYLRLP